MDRIEKPRPRRPSKFANQGEVAEADAAALESPGGREDHKGMPEAGRLAASELKQPVGAHPRSEVTGRHDPGSGANETIDGLSDTEEALREAAEDVPIDAPEKPLDDTPVFDRADALPKV